MFGKRKNTEETTEETPQPKLVMKLKQHGIRWILRGANVSSISCPECGRSIFSWSFTVENKEYEATIKCSTCKAQYIVLRRDTEGTTEFLAELESGNDKMKVEKCPEKTDHTEDGKINQLEI